MHHGAAYLFGSLILIGCGGSSASLVSGEDSGDARMDSLGDGDGDAGTDGSDERGPDAMSDARVDACSSLFTPCAADSECCTPYRCLNITGTPQCQLEGPIPEDSASDVSMGDGQSSDAALTEGCDPDAAPTCADGFICQCLGGAGLSVHCRCAKQCQSSTECGDPYGLCGCGASGPGVCMSSCECFCG